MRDDTFAYEAINSNVLTEEFSEIDRLLPRFRYEVVKRIVGVMLVLLSLPVSLPICVFLAIAVMVSSTGPIFYREDRLGRYGKSFRIWKFRSMYVSKEQQDIVRKRSMPGQIYDRMHKHCDDPRITPLGRVLRKWSLDELPQLINVLKGEMTLIGPRPIVKAERELYGEKFKYYCMVRPGLSGLWQVSGRSCLQYKERILLDCRYVLGWSLWLDTKILIKTLQVVIKAQGAC